MDFGLPWGSTHLVSLITVLPCRRGLYREKHMLFYSILFYSGQVQHFLSKHRQHISVFGDWPCEVWMSGLCFFCVIAYWIMNSFVQWYLSQDTCCTRTHMWFLIFVLQLLMCRKISFSLVKASCASPKWRFLSFFSKGVLHACGGVVFAIVFNNVSDCKAALGWQTQQCAPLKRL